ncbi:hypothetical protein MACJ_000451 [Theileria orientalis]|uniref:CCHC-type domain-containing protein n=1 Tax=Theileria orientalis TaxID=68886 RepID=A0A976M440_THEOR|nr:hypothetical protein MACJ_000451 [Theileria orientalis]
MIPKEKRSYVDCWDEGKIKQALEERIEELKIKNDKSKSRIKLLRSKIAKLRRALEGKGTAGGQVAPSGGARSGKGSRRATKKGVKVANSEDGNNSEGVKVVKSEDANNSEDAKGGQVGGQNADGSPDNCNSDLISGSNADAKSVAKGTGSKSIDKTKKRSKRICFGCRKRGHLLKDCRENRAETVCFRCGSKEHTLKSCKFKSNAAAAVGEEFAAHQEGLGVAEETTVELPYASCFVCGQVGHLSSQCPQNPKGMYPRGSGCYFCGSVRHKRAHCPLAKGRVGASGSNSVPIGVTGGNNVHI